MTREELIEKVAAQISTASFVRFTPGTYAIAEAAIDIVLEEAARIAEERPPRSSIADGDETEAYLLALDDAADAIRALKSGDGE